jgi:hypothetical protein
MPLRRRQIIGEYTSTIPFGHITGSMNVPGDPLIAFDPESHATVSIKRSDTGKVLSHRQAIRGKFRAPLF